MERGDKGRIKKGNIPWNKGLKGIHLAPNTEFKKGMESWCKGTKGIMKPNSGSFKKGNKMNDSIKEKISNSMKGVKNRLGSKVSSETKEKMSNCHKGSKNYNWKSDRTKLSVDERKHLDTKYKIWMKEVKDRDKWVCRMNNKDCKGRMEAHHILSWIDYPELRYEINNGITLCVFHHPRKKADANRLVPVFNDMLCQ